MECVTTASFSLSINGSLHGYFNGRMDLRQEEFTYHHNCSNMNIINLFFADDLFLFTHGDVNLTRIIMEALDEFKSVSGLVPSLPKSTLPVKHLGVPLVTTRLVYRDCKELVEKV
uniref:Reverse transcriptase domain-containing protein n=1 Tax=Tanacetum cinerariifolium TaxID=118510 RepID=A0A699TZT3_TANCI|nr:hypothetical protein [Tanacetum cinerariifolium]